MDNKKFIWQEGDLRTISEEELKNNGIVYQDPMEKDFDILSTIGITDYDDEDIENSEYIAKRLFLELRGVGVRKDTVGKIFENFYSYCINNLPQGVSLTKELYYCTKVQLVNLITDFSDYKFSDSELNDIFS